ncbi:hypothetical protein ASPTUDRAFT_441996 [Aspergillus tubingensis CBS 134.48]|uniref:Uncharacterized protein n=1 Tax=Aspergillus tubingensis (strain CBS 134.48) TaxID=767770 RepID=A0A1L9N9L9_ASPTC|nr:hypothetical protein ASPTUDRAFT_441996 [Aspergillus tubingensis CBS 134.48]
MGTTKMRQGSATWKKLVDGDVGGGARTRAEQREARPSGNLAKVKLFHCRQRPMHGALEP